MATFVQGIKIELSSCPFCGSEAHMESFKAAGEKLTRYRVRCNRCWCMTDWEANTVEDAMNKWNRRF